MTPALQRSAVAGKGGDANQGRGLAVADRAELAHPGQQGRRRDGADARHGSQDSVALGEILRARDQLLDPPFVLADAGVDLREDLLGAPRPTGGSPISDTTAFSCTRWSTRVSRITIMSRRRSIVTSAGAVAGMAGNAAPKAARILASTLSVFASSPPALAKSLDWRGLTTTVQKPRVVQRLQERPVHPPRGLHDDPHRVPLPEDAGDLAEAVRVVCGGRVPPVDVNVERRLAHVDSGTYCGHVSRSYPRDDPVLEPSIHSGPGRLKGGRADHA